MKNLIVVALLTLVAGVGFIALGGAEHARAAPAPQPVHYKCYKAKHAKHAPRFLGTTVFLDDQFDDSSEGGSRETRVLKLATFCSGANQFDLDGESASPPHVHLTCYTTRDGPRVPRFEPVNVEVSDKITDNTSQLLTLRRPDKLCTFALKGKGNTETSADYRCYQARIAKGQPRFQQVNAQIYDQFSITTGETRFIRPVSYCSIVEKKAEANNDNIEDATFVSDQALEFEDHSSTVNARLQPSDPALSCQTGYGHSVWYRWNSSQDMSLMVDLFQETTYRTVVAAFEDLDSGPGIDLDEVACNRDDGDSEDCPFPVIDDNEEECASLQFDAEANTDYYILVGSIDGRGGKLKFDLDSKRDATNDSRCAPTNINTNGGLDYADHASTMNATIIAGVGEQICSPADPALVSPCIVPYSHSVWYEYTPPKHQKVSFDTFDSSYDTVLAVFDGSTQVACNDDYSGDQSFVNVTLNQGTRYRILVGSYGSGSNGGKLKFHATLFASLGGQSAAAPDAAAVAANSLTCYQVRQRRMQPITVELVDDQFSDKQLNGSWTLTLSGVDSVCVPSTKTAVCPAGAALAGAGEPGRCPE